MAMGTYSAKSFRAERFQSRSYAGPGAAGGRTRASPVRAIGQRVSHHRTVVLTVVAAALFALLSARSATASNEDVHIAMSLAEMLRSARTVISSHQDKINDPAVGDKGLTGDVVLAEAIAIYKKKTGADPSAVDPQSRLGRLLRAQMKAIRQVVDEHQDTINQKGLGFKGFIPAVFGRLVNERFGVLSAGEASMKVTAPPELVRNRKARPDRWEQDIIATRLATPSWTKGEPFSAMASVDDRSAFRVLVPEYYTPSCLTCHGEPRGELDVTGYPKEGGRAGDLGGVISITLFQ